MVGQKGRSGGVRKGCGRKKGCGALLGQLKKLQGDDRSQKVDILFARASVRANDPAAADNHERAITDVSEGTEGPDPVIQMEMATTSTGTDEHEPVIQSENTAAVKDHEVLTGKKNIADDEMELDALIPNVSVIETTKRMTKHGQQRDWMVYRCVTLFSLN